MEGVLTGPDAAEASGAPDALFYRDLGDGRALVSLLMVPGHARLVIWEIGTMWYDDVWCYASPGDSLVPIAEWDGTGDPPGRWTRHIRTARRRAYGPDGEITREWVAT